MCEEGQFHKLESRVDAVEERLTKVETSLADMRSEVRVGFDEMRGNFTTVVVRMVDEKSKWGDLLREIVRWSARTILLGALAAMSMTAYKLVFGA